MNSRRIASLAMLAVLGIFVCTGCADKLTRARFDMIQVGYADHFDVEKTIGEPSDKLDTTWHYERVDKHLNVMIHFDDQSKVWRKEWHDTLDGVHYDSAEPGADADTYESTRVRKID